MKKKQFLILTAVLILVFGGFLLIKLNDKKNTDNQELKVNSARIKGEQNQSVIDYSSETEMSFSYEEVVLDNEELKKYREEIETAGFDSTLFSDQEIQKMAIEIEKNSQTVSEYLKNKTDKIIDKAEIEKARKELQEANIDPNKFHNNEIIDLIKQSKKEKKSVVDLAKSR